MKLYGIYEQVVGVPASSLSQLRGPWSENVEDPWTSWLYWAQLALMYGMSENCSCRLQNQEQS